MGYSRESLNAAISLKLTDIDQASGMHKGLFVLTQIAGVGGLAGALLLAPLAWEVAVIAAAAGAAFYSISQLMQSQRLGHFLPLPGVPLSAANLTHGLSAIAAQMMGAAPPPLPEEVKLLPVDWLPEKERRVNYLLTYCSDIIISAAETAQDGISFSAIVDSAVRASEFAITDAQLSNPITGMKLAGAVRAVLTGDTSGIEAQQNAAISAEYRRAQAELAAGVIRADEFAAIEAQVREIAPDAVTPAIVASVAPAQPDAATATPTATAPNTNAAGERTDWRDVLDLVKDQNTYPAIAVIGPQGTGKTTLVDYLLSTLKRDKIVLDPHYRMGAWPGCRVIGAGMDYAAVGEALANIAADVKERYQQRATFAGYQPMPVTLVLEEQTNWADKVDGASQFVKESLSDIRKVGYQTIAVAHAETNTARGGAAGTAKMRQQGELKIVLLEKGLAKVSVKGRETFLLRFPDPTPYTISTGQPVMDRGGDLGPGYIGANYVDPQPWSAVTQNTTVATGDEATAWATFKAEAVPELAALMLWIEKQTGPFTARRATQNKTVRQAQVVEVTEGVWEGLTALVSARLIEEIAAGEFIRLNA